MAPKRAQYNMDHSVPFISTPAPQHKSTINHVVAEKTTPNNNAKANKGNDTMYMFFSGTEKTAPQLKPTVIPLRCFIAKRNCTYS